LPTSCGHDAPQRRLRQPAPNNRRAALPLDRPLDEDCAMPSDRRRDAQQDIVLVSGADDGYAMPLAATVRSAAAELRGDRRLRLFILDGGLTADSKARLAASWQDPRLSVEWLQPEVNRIRDLPVSDHISSAAYLRLLMAELLPRDVRRVIYLDADMLVRRDLADLWDEPQGDHPVLAVQDMAAPYLDAAAAAANFDRCHRRLAAARPVANYEQLGLPADGKYFNSGLLVIDLERWRREDLGQRVLDCLREHRRHVLWWDQYALNVVLAGRWRPLDLRWNQGAHIYTYPTWRESWLDRETFAQVRLDPWIVHYCSPDKPWHYFCRHPFTRDFRRALRDTAWSDWRPARPPKYLSRLWDFHYRPLRNEWKRRIGALKQSIRDKRRRAA
jgi:lipopolysaccharide biosynthesis glycosyltransferase